MKKAKPTCVADINLSPENINRERDYFMKKLTL